MLGLSCGPWDLHWNVGLVAPKACGILVPRTGTDLVSPALEGRF